MKYCKNDRGYVLLNVLIIIILIISFGMLLIPKTINTSLQIQKNEGNTQAKDMSEMGIHYTHAYLQTLVSKAIEESKKDTRYMNNTINHDTLFCEKLKVQFSYFNTFFPKEIRMDANQNHLFQIRNFEPYSITAKNDTKVSTCDSFKNMTVPIESIGKVEGKSEKSIKAIFVIENKVATETVPGTGGGGTGGGTVPVDPNKLPLVNVTDPVKLSGQSTTQMYSSAHFFSAITIGGNGKLMIGGNAWFEGVEAHNKPYSVTFNGNNGILVISGDAYFKYPVDLGGTNTNYVCIRGNAYRLRTGTTNTWDPYPEIKTAQTCPPLIEQQVEYFYDISEWGIIESNLNVIY